MPWEKSFDENEIVDRAMRVFWSKGYASSSINDLTSATGINRGSLYNAFGGKLKLFTRGLLKYDLEHRRSFLSELEAMNDPLASFERCFEAVIAETLTDKEKKGCFLVNTASELPFHEEEVRTIVNRGLLEFEQFFQRGIEVAQARKQVPLSVHPANAAKALMAMIVAIRVLGRGVFSETALHAIATEAKRLLK